MIPYHALDPNIRETVRLCVELGFHTTDSGDGEAKFKPLRDGRPNPRAACALDFPHVVMTCAPRELAAEADRLVAALAEMGVLLVGLRPMTPEQAEEWGCSWEPPPAGAVAGCVEATYSPGDGFGVIMLSHVTDEVLRECGALRRLGDGE